MAYAASLSGSKLRAKLGASLNERVSAPTSAFAQRQLQQMGWSEGEGLGKKRQGMSSHITVKRREDNVGLGHSVGANHHDEWWKDSLGDTLAKLSSSSKKKKKKKRNFTDEELFQATGGARFGMRAQRRAEAKWARTESSLTEEDEREAQARAEWNGQGDAEIKVNDDKALKKKRKITDISSDSSEIERPKKRRSKKQNKRKKETPATESASATLGTETLTTKSKKKKQKKEKKAKKEKKRKSGTDKS